MKTLYLLRHAKSSWDRPELEDHERPLARRGKRAAQRMAEHIADAGIRPDSVSCSPAVRARDTLDAFLSHWDPPPPVQRDVALYPGSAADLLAWIQTHGNEHPSQLLVGHNPGLHDLARILVGSGDRKLMARLAHKLPTGSWLEIAFPVDTWHEIEPGLGRLARFVRPRALG